MTEIPEINRMIQEMRAQRVQDKQTLADLDAALADAKADEREAKAEEDRAYEDWCAAVAAAPRLPHAPPTTDVITYASARDTRKAADLRVKVASQQVHNVLMRVRDQYRDRDQFVKDRQKRETEQFALLARAVCDAEMPEAHQLRVAARAWEIARQSPFCSRVQSPCAPGAWWRRFEAAEPAAVQPEVAVYDWAYLRLVAAEMELRHLVYDDEETEADMKQAQALVAREAEAARTAIAPIVEGLVALGLCLPLPNDSGLQCQE